MTQTVPAFVVRNLTARDIFGINLPYFGFDFSADDVLLNKGTEVAVFDFSLAKEHNVFSAYVNLNGDQDTRDLYLLGEFLSFDEAGLPE